MSHRFKGRADVPKAATLRRKPARTSADCEYPLMGEIRYSDGSARVGVAMRPSELPPFGLNGAELTFVRIDFQTRLQFGQTEIVIETPFDLVSGTSTQRLDPEDRPALGPLLAVYPAALDSAVVQPDLTVVLTFDGGVKIVVPQDQHYESWHVVGPGSRLIVCPPTGTGLLSVWT
jgi:hypothetical protein